MNLKQYINTLYRNYQIPLNEKIDICLKTAKVIKALHDESIVHLDLKPANILVDLSNSK
jgi:serine/threonine protein kinase